MKRFTMVLFSFLFLLVCGCQDKAPVKEESYADHQALTATEIAFDPDTMLRVNLEQAGLVDVFIRDMVPECRLSAEERGTVYLLADDRYGGGMTAVDHYLAIVCRDSMVLHDMSLSGISFMGGELTAADFDGDGDEELLLFEAVAGASGGFGQYVTRVLDVSDQSLTVIYSSHKESAVVDTGFSAEILPDNCLTVHNRFTDYSETFMYDDHPLWYDENGNPQTITLSLDRFYHCEAVDLDRDGVYELCCDQYASLYGHADYVGTASTVLRYDVDTATFEVADASFTP